MAEARRPEVMLPWGILFLQKYVEALHMFVEDKEESSLKVAMSTLVKAKDPFLWRGLALIGYGEQEAPALRKRAPSQKRREKVLAYHALPQKSAESKEEREIHLPT